MFRATLCVMPWLVALAALGCDGAEIEDDGGLVGPPEAMWGTYDGRLFGDWYGTCLMMISTGALLEDLHAENQGWVSDIDGRHHAASVEEVDGSWHFTFPIEVMTEHGPDDQLWEFAIPEDGLTAEGFEGEYSHTGHFTGTVIGVIRGTRQN